MASAASEVTWLLGLLTELGVEIQMPILVFSDSKSTIQLAANPVGEKNT